MTGQDAPNFCTGRHGWGNEDSWCRFQEEAFDVPGVFCFYAYHIDPSEQQMFSYIVMHIFNLYLISSMFSRLFGT